MMLIWLFVVTSWAAPVEQLALVAENFASSVPKLKFYREPERGVFIGEIDDLEVKQIVVEMTDRSEGFFQDETKFSAKILRQKKAELEAWSRSNKSHSKFSIKEKEIWVRGTDAKTLKSLKEIFPFLKHRSKRARRSRDDPGPPIHLELAFVEIQNKAVERLGLRFGSPISFASNLYLQKINRPAELLKVAGFNPMGSFLDFVLKGGEGKIHFKQSLVGRDREESQFQVGGEFSIRLSAESYAKIATISYGVDLKFRPRRLDRKNVAIDLNVNIREPSSSGGLDGLPLIQIKKLDTEVRAQFGETMMIGGFVRRQKLKGSQGIPGLSQIPFFGRLLSSRDYLNNRSEAYLMITPSLPSETLTGDQKNVD